MSIRLSDGIKKHNLVLVCCVCNRSHHEGEWDHHEHHKEAINEHRATHGFCEPCLQKNKKEVGIDFD